MPVPAPTAAQLAAVETRLRALLDPYAATLEWATIYGFPTLRRAGAGAHDWFAFVKPAARHVSLLLLQLHTDAELRASLSPALARRLTGRSAFNFATLSDAEESELRGLLARAYAAYVPPA